MDETTCMVRALGASRILILKESCASARPAAEEHGRGCIASCTALSTARGARKDLDLLLSLCENTRRAHHLRAGMPLRAGTGLPQALSQRV